MWGNATYSVGGEYFTIVDQASIDKFKKEGIKLSGAYQINGAGMMTPKGGNDINITIPPLPKLSDDLANFISKGGVVYKADTLAELAEATGMNATKLKISVNRYNKAVESKNDDFFYKKAEYLKYTVEKGPFYAIRVRGSAYGSIGGVRINENIQALKSDGQPIAGLYVAGADAGGMYDNSYPDLEGLTMSFAMNSGRIAGENAAAYSLEK
jgi:fumarate reductase flavoprotein subunit